MLACTEAVSALNGKFYPKLCRREGGLEVTLQDAELTAWVSIRKYKALLSQLHRAQRRHQLPWLQLDLPPAEACTSTAVIKVKVNPRAAGIPAWADVTVGEKR
jgi:hypothetical protein